MAISSKYSGGTGSAPQGVSINDNRRIFNFGERVAELNPVASPFFTYLSKVSRKPTDDPVFKFLEQRHQWQRRNLEVQADFAAVTVAAGARAVTGLKLGCTYDTYGRTKSDGYLEPCGFLLGIGDSVGQIVNIKSSVYVPDGGTAKSAIIGIRITAVTATTASSASADGYTTVSGDVVSIDGKAIAAANDDDSIDFADGDMGQVVGSAHAEGGKAPDGWEDAMYDREGYVQIFKTAMKLFSGTAMATRYRGEADEFKRIWRDKLMEHKMDIEHAMLFGVGASDEAGTGPIRKTWGIMPYTQQYGTNFSFQYASSSYDNFLDAMESYFAPESGNSGDKLVLASRKIIGWLNKLGSETFLKNTVGTSQYRMDVQNIKGAFGHNVTKVNTIFGNLHFVAEPLLRGAYEDYAIAVDTGNVAYRPLVGNGQNRDTHIMTNIQSNDEDGRRDQVLTEAGLEISLPETHALMSFS